MTAGSDAPGYVNATSRSSSRRGSAPILSMPRCSAASAYPAESWMSLITAPTIGTLACVWVSTAWNPVNEGTRRKPATPNSAIAAKASAGPLNTHASPADQQEASDERCVEHEPGNRAEEAEVRPRTSRVHAVLVDDLCDRADTAA